MIILDDRWSLQAEPPGAGQFEAIAVGAGAWDQLYLRMGITPAETFVEDGDVAANGEAHDAEVDVELVGKGGGAPANGTVHGGAGTANSSCKSHSSCRKGRGVSERTASDTRTSSVRTVLKESEFCTPEDVEAWTSKAFNGRGASSTTVAPHLHLLLEAACGYFLSWQPGAAQ